MKISVVIPAYNSSSTIIKSISSVQNQKLIDSTDLEIIIVNDGSTDNTEYLVREYISNNSGNIVIINKDNGGVSSARNLGIRESTGEWIAFLDSDDEWLPNKLQKQIDIIKSTSGVNFIGCARNGEVLSILGRKIETLYEASFHDLLVKMFPQTSTALVRKDILNTVGYYNETMTHSEDGELWLRICSKGGFYYLPDSLVLTGNGKENFGESGLSSNLKMMHLGTLKMLELSYEDKIISRFDYNIFKIFYYLKYLRRIIIVKMRK
ncbi:glycosyltransferase family 2 protein [Photobacterium damselae subsp. damselae]|uniref:glycosyltransferase family 2 protein n=1 Tax=Photobacterium damselae TaxID=38293 RepID=UPI001593607E|nr:glycosyltransferase family A protein [Photobacterium damselae]NVH52664.1 glycosyltransferase family 2 protein [Photobacterium damselae subsp. damselae]NVO81656.1 glycosyltransferase family 2 protein [Photobacterium damselae subsp. damselae]